MHAGQFAESHGDGVGDESGDDVAEDYAGAGDFEGGGGAEKKPGADGAADRHHGHLSGGELMVETLFVDLILRTISGTRSGERHGARYQNQGQWTQRIGDRFGAHRISLN